MYVEVIPNRNSPPCILLRESYRDGDRILHRTLANLTHCPPEVIDAVRAACRRHPDPTVSTADFAIVRTLPHGHVAAVLGTLRGLGLETLLARRRSRTRDLVVAMIAARVLAPGSKLATARQLSACTATCTLGRELGLDAVTADEFYAALDWLLVRQEAIEQQLAARHLADGTLVLYDVSGSYYTGKHCPLAKFGHSRDGKPRFPQILYGLLCNGAGCPVAVEVFPGNTADPETLDSQIQKVRTRFGLARVVLVGDRGVLTTARIEEEVKGVPGLDWITALRAPAIRALAEQRLIQPSLFDQQDLAEITAPEYPGERLVVCRNPFLAAERAQRRQELLAATERQLADIVAATTRPKRALRGAAKIGVRVGRVLHRFKVAKHFVLEITDTRLAYHRDEARIAAEAALDGLYVIRTSVAATTLAAADAVRAYKDLAKVERAFRSLKTVDLKVRPIFHWRADRVRAHVFVCMLAYYVEWHLRQRLAPLLFDDDDRATAAALRDSVVAPAQPSPRAERKARTKRTDAGEPVHSFQTLLKDLGTISQHEIHWAELGAPPFWKTTVPTALQARALALLEVKL